MVNGAAGVVVTVRGRPMTVIGFTVVGRRIAEIDVVADLDRVDRLAAAAPSDEWPREAKLVVSSDRRRAVGIGSHTVSDH